MKTSPKRATIYLNPDLHQALYAKAVVTGRSVSELVNQAVKALLAENDEDMAVFEERRHEPGLPFEDVLKDLKLRGKI